VHCYLKGIFTHVVSKAALIIQWNIKYIHKNSLSFFRNLILFIIASFIGYSIGCKIHECEGIFIFIEGMFVTNTQDEEKSKCSNLFKGNPKIVLLQAEVKKSREAIQSKHGKTDKKVWRHKTTPYTY